MIPFLILVLFFQLLPENDFEEIFGTKYSFALKEMRSLNPQIDSLAETYELDAELMAATVFPEFIRYSIVRDIIEINSLEIVYVNTGMADFSIGPLQIKPSFAEKIEQIVINEKYLEKYRNNFQYYTENSIEIRKERVRRLKSAPTQLQYIAVFQKYMYHKFPFLRYKSKYYQLKFLSTAYNSGFQSPRKEIEARMDGKYFPWGIFNEKKKYNYSEIAWYFYRREYSANQ